MAKAKRCTYRKMARPTGLSSAATPHGDTNIKLEGKIVGKITGPSRFGHDKWRIRIMVQKERTTEDPAEFYWVFFKAALETEAEARAWFQKNEDLIRDKYALYQSEDDF